MLAFHKDPRMGSAEVENSRSDAAQALFWVGGWEGDLGHSSGLGKREKPEDPDYLLLLAVPWPKRGLNTFSV